MRCFVYYHAIVYLSTHHPRPATLLPRLALPADVPRPAIWMSLASSLASLNLFQHIFQPWRRPPCGGAAASGPSGRVASQGSFQRMLQHLTIDLIPRNIPHPTQSRNRFHHAWGVLLTIGCRCHLSHFPILPSHRTHAHPPHPHPPILQLNRGE